MSDLIPRQTIFQSSADNDRCASELKETLEKQGIRATIAKVDDRNPSHVSVFYSATTEQFPGVVAAVIAIEEGVGGKSPLSSVPSAESDPPLKLEDTQPERHASGVRHRR